MSTLPVSEDLVLIIDDEPTVLTSLTAMLKANGLSNVLGCADERQVLELVGSRQPEAVLLDLGLPHIPGEKLLADIRAGFPHIPVIVVTASNDVQAAVDCMRAGAFDYMVKPVEESRLAGGVKQALSTRQLERNCRRLKNKLLAPTLSNPQAFAHITTHNRAMHAIFLIIESIADSGEPVLITGETGVGKELIAQAIHRASGRSGLFVPVNVAGLDDEQFANTLFGHRKGAFTGAQEALGGMIQQAAGGTLLLDEVGDLSLTSQVKLLRLLDSGEYLPLGADLPKRSTARIVATTNRDLDARMAEGKFRNDLYYRLSTHWLHIPPLRERTDDLPLLLNDLLREAAEKGHKEIPPVPAELPSLLATCDFPGNIRSLRRAVINALAGHSAGDLPLDPFRELLARAKTRTPVVSAASPAENVVFPACLPTLRQVRELLIAEALKRSGGNQSIAAGLLGISHQALSKRLKPKP
jgi:DNA-binding NtrC family response regulator